MSAIKTQQDIQDAIRELEDRQLAEKNALQEHFQGSLENLKPINLIKDTLSEVNRSHEIKKELVKAAVALAIGYVTKKVIDNYISKRKKPSITSRIVGIVQVLITAWIAKNGVIMKNIALHFFKLILNKRLQQRQLRIS